MPGSAASCDAKICTATMADEPATAEETIFLDTSLIVAATVEAHPSHVVAGAFVDEIVGRGARIHISPQVCREFSSY